MRTDSLFRRFPGVVLFSEIYQGEPSATDSARVSFFLLTWLLVTGPVARFARQIAGQGYIVAAPSSYHDFTGPEPLAYDVPGTDQGNEWKVKKVGASHREESLVLFIDKR